MFLKTPRSDRAKCWANNDNLFPEPEGNNNNFVNKNGIKNVSYVASKLNKFVENFKILSKDRESNKLNTVAAQVC